MLKKYILLILLFFIIPQLSISGDKKGEGVHLKIVNKNTSKKYDLILPLGQFYEISSRSLTIYQCILEDRKKGNEEIALIKFSNNKFEDQNNFFGWIVKSSPSLVIIEDSILDITLKKCLLYDPVFPELIEIN